MVTALKRIQQYKPEDRARYEELQNGLPLPQSDGSVLVVEKRTAISTVLSRTADLTPEQFMTAAIAEANNLPVGTREVTVVKAVFNAAALGLLLGAGRGHAYLVPFKDKKASDRSGVDTYDCQLIIGYFGFIALAYRTGFLRSLTTEVVLTDEDCEIWMDETGRRLKHKIPLSRKAEPNGQNIKAAYCVYQTRTGGRGITVSTKDEIDAAKNPYSDVWRWHYPAMAKKTAVRRAAKEWALTDSLSFAVKLDEQAEAGLDQMSLVDESELQPAEIGPKVRQPAAVPSRQTTLPEQPAPAKIVSPQTQVAKETVSAPVSIALPAATKAENGTQKKSNGIGKPVASTQPVDENGPSESEVVQKTSVQESVPPTSMEPPITGSLIVDRPAEEVLQEIAGGKVTIESGIATLVSAVLSGVVSEGDYLRLRAAYMSGNTPLLSCLRDIEDSESIAECREATIRLHALRQTGLNPELHRLLSRRASARLTNFNRR